MKKYTMDELIEIVSRLRKECPWDSVQTHESLKTCLIEETYEVIEAIDEGDGNMMADEMGDLLMQILLHAEIGKEEEKYDLSDVVSSLANKMVRRHPKIFGSEENSPQSWDEIKKKEKKLETNADFLKNISKNLPALQRSLKFSKNLRKWEIEKDSISQFCEKSKDILSKIEKSQYASEEELGQLLYNISAICGLFGGSGELILNKFLENFTKTLEK